MRQENIDFRIWCPHGKFFINWSPAKYFRIHGISRENLVFQQFTGVLDVKKDKIYEGDLVVLTETYSPEPNMQNIFEIIFERGAFCLAARKLSKGSSLHFSYTKYIMGFDKNGDEIYKYVMPPPRPIYNFNICQVIGNIFENKNLLKK